MTEAELRALVRETIAQHLGGRPGVATQGPASVGGVVGDAVSRAPASATALVAGHMSHALFVLPAGDGPCLIEPTVACNHCGFCKSYGH